MSALLSVQRSEDEAGAPSQSGVPGTTSNVPTDKKGKPAAEPSASSRQSSKSESAQYGVNRTVIHTVSPSGRVQRVTAALLIDDAVVKTVKGDKVTYSKRPRTQEELNKIQELAQAAIGFDAKRGDTITVQNMSFDTNGANGDLPAAGWASQVQKTVSDYSSLLRPLSLLALFALAYLFVVRPVQKQAFSRSELGGGMQAALATGGAHELGGGLASSADHAQRAAQLKMQAFEMVKQKPVDTARAMQAWIREEKQ